MTTFYLDAEGGNDANAGTSFALRWKTMTNGATAARIAPGDTIRVMGSPAPTSLGINGTWTNGPQQAIKIIASSTNATPIVLAVTAHGYSTGDTVNVLSHATNTKANGVWEIIVTDADHFSLTGSVGNGVGIATGSTRKISSGRVTLASAVTQAVACLGNRGTLTNWTASANVTCAISTADFKEGGECQSVAIGASFTTGLAAFLATGTIDLSPYKQLTFWIKQTTGTTAVAGDVSLRLCSDVAGVTTVNQFNIPALLSSNRWMPFTVDLAVALGSSIKSIAFYVGADRGAQTFLIDAISAVKDSTSDDSLSQTSLISKNTGDEGWWPIQSINGTRVMLDADPNNNTPVAAIPLGYGGATATVTTYKRETIKVAISSDSGVVNDSGTAGNLITFSGGWDRTNMSSQTLETFWDGTNAQTNGMLIDGKSYIRIDKINLYRFGVSLQTLTPASIAGCEIGTMMGGSNSGNPCILIGGTGLPGWSLGTVTVVSASSGGVGITGTNVTATKILALGSAASGFSNGGGGYIATLEGRSSSLLCGIGNRIDSAIADYGATVTLSGNDSVGSISQGTVSGSVAIGVNFNGNYNTVGSAIAENNGTFGLNFGGTIGNIVYGGHTSNNITAGVTTNSGRVSLRNFTINEATEVTITTSPGYLNSSVASENHDGTPGNHQIFSEGGLISSDSSVRHTASGISWALNPTSAIRTSVYPLTLSLAKIAVAANALVTVSLWTRRTSTGLTQRLVCKGGQLAGVPADVAATSTEAINTWGGDGAGGPLVITFTPTEAGVIEIVTEAYGGTANTGYVDDLSVTQA